MPAGDSQVQPRCNNRGQAACPFMIPTLLAAGILNLIFLRGSLPAGLPKREPEAGVVQMTGGPMAWFDLAQSRYFVPAARHRVVAARVKVAARWWVDRARHVALKNDAVARPGTVFRDWHRRQQCFGIGMQRHFEEAPPR